MRALRLVAHGIPGKFELRDVANPQPAPGEAVVEVHACGLNHLDLWSEAGELPISINLPLTPGCEIAGRVLRAGEEVKEWKSGDRVAVQSNLFCGSCEYCRRGDESMCIHNVMLGVQRDGGFAEQVVVPARALVQLPDEVDFTTSAALTLAGSTAMHMLTNRTTVKPGDWVLVMAGASGVGSAAIQIARGLGARVIGTGSSEAKRELARQLGAEAALDLADANWTAEVRKLTAKRGVDLVIEHIGAAVLQQAFNCLARGGTIVTCGATTGREIPFDLWPFFVKQQRLIGSYGRNTADLKATLQWAADGRLKAVIDSSLPLARTPRAYELLRSRKVLGKLVIRPVEKPHI
jgi:2-desacetyl-2-hydroxyethyl bacteriochlorophyllide A dehydrogenase